MSQERVRIRVTGDVQGVGFRYSARNMASSLGLVGWVRNERDGRTVEVVAEGPTEAVDRLVAWCRRGPSRAQVDDVQVERDAATGEFAGFSVRY